MRPDPYPMPLGKILALHLSRSLLGGGMRAGSSMKLSSGGNGEAPATEVRPPRTPPKAQVLLGVIQGISLALGSTLNYL